MSVNVTKTTAFLVQDSKTNTVAYCTFTLNDSIVIRGARLVSGRNGIFLAMPSRMIKKEGEKPEYQDIVFPCNKETRTLLETAAKAEYEKQAAEAGVIS